MKNKYFYDLHLHSCLSPCGDDEMTPNSVAGMCALNGLNIAALTDHNTTENCPAFFAACKKYGVIPVAGMEMTTAEDVHIVCLFESLEDAMSFNEEYQKERILYKNKPDIFGRQLVMNELDEIIREEENLLLNGSRLSISESCALARRFNGVCFPAHIDRQENGIIAVLGDIPEEENFSCIEFRSPASIEQYTKDYGLYDKLVLTDSDAHYLWDINEGVNFLMIEDEPYSSALVRHNLIEMLRRGAKE